MLREKVAKSYSVGPYFLSKLVAEIPGSTHNTHYAHTATNHPAPLFVPSCVFVCLCV